MQHQNLFKNLFQKSAWDSDNALMLQEEALSYPYFSLVHFYLLKETGIGHGNYESIAAKVALHYNNTYLLHLQMHQDNSNKASKTDAKVEIAQHLANPEHVEEKLLTRKDVNVNNEDELIFEPLFASDYFASQGIKLSEEMQNTDKLGKQMRSFTEWLKTMKKANSNRLPENVKLDKAVEQLAEKSNIETEVITEAMAEVYLQQGKTGKANEIYKKLSLHNPAKSLYFAGKIETLKEN